ncbi:glycerophosphodiester phosphodiesterase [Jeongeupia naejangsanensis]|uniref:Glycerophosphodiester phosphodiesterase n=1 Tax=Jeongeupia naejangsanensis TaxID=613195 RepID=A0ABS2BEZ7_9NEIS|nr:glycerophosphodiester phosphodiesterase [Jeongeupia naejangsanensis]MBM3114197.1 glycerophosphodiester phosphodiesterase [Jeongeupia naejangsanensis]
MQLIAHRGLARTVPENTLAAFAAALSSGFDGLETDIRLCADGEAVLCHDRITPNGAPVASLTRKALSHQLGYLVPTLAEALDAFPEALWNLEIKSPDAIKTAFEIIAASRHTPRILLSSFRHDIVLAAAELLKVDCALLVAHHPASLAGLVQQALPHERLRSIVWDFEIIDTALLEQAADLGFRSYVYGAHTQYEHAFCRDYQVSGIITDHPEFVGLTPVPALQ